MLIREVRPESDAHRAASHFPSARLGARLFTAPVIPPPGWGSSAEVRAAVLHVDVITHAGRFSTLVATPGYETHRLPKRLAAGCPLMGDDETSRNRTFARRAVR